MLRTLLIVVTLLIPNTIRAEKYAILIGVTSYESPILRELPFAENDVSELSQVLQENGFAKGNIVLMTTTEATATRKARFSPRAKNIRRELQLYLSLPQKGDTVVVALAGHGVQLKGDKEHYFCPVDADLKAKENLVSIADLYDQLADCDASVKLLFVDACRDDPLSGNVPRSVKDNIASKTRPKLPDPPGGVGALFSCRAGEQAFEAKSLKHGVFFHFLLEGLRGAARNIDNQITVDDLKSYVGRKVPAYAYRELRALQRPEFKGEIDLGVPLVAGLPKRFTNSIGMEFVMIPKGTFTMGSPKTEKDRGDDETQHEVEITKDFYMGVTEVTQAQYKRIMGTNPSRFSSTGGSKHKVQGMNTDDFPVESVPYRDVGKFFAKLNELEAEKQSNREYRLPTEAEWEYTCRGGASAYQVFHFGNALSSTQANFNGDEPYGGAAKGPNLSRTTSVKSYNPNAFGVYDMHGNVMERCSDRYADDYYNKSPRKDPTGPTADASFVLRGGSWGFRGRGCRSAARILNSSFAVKEGLMGFRVVCIPSNP